MSRIMKTILFALLLLSTAAHIRASTPAASKPNFNFESEVENIMFEFYVNLFKYLSSFIGNTKSLSEKVLQDQAITQNKDLEQPKATLEAYIADVNERMKPLPKDATALDGFLVIVARIHTVNLFQDIVQKYNTSALATPSEEDVLIEAVLKRNGLDELISQFKARKMAFLNEFLGKMDTHMATLTEESKQKNEKIIGWYDKYRSASDEERAKDVFTNFMQMVKIGNF